MLVHQRVTITDHDIPNPKTQHTQPGRCSHLRFAGDSRELPCDLVLRSVGSEPQPLHRWDLLRCGAGGHGCAGRGIFVGRWVAVTRLKMLEKNMKKHDVILMTFYGHVIILLGNQDATPKSSGFGRCVWKQKTGGLVWCFKPLFLRHGINEDVYMYVLRSFNFGRDRCWRW